MSQGVGLHQSLNLSQTLSPQMQQSLQYLQAPVMELRSMIQQEMSANPVLEENEPFLENSEDEWDRELEELQQIDQEWRDYFSQSQYTNSQRSEKAEEKRQFLFDSQISQASLSDILKEQLHLASYDPEILRAGDHIIGNIDPDGYLEASIEEIESNTGLKETTIETALELIQSFHPSGVGARNLRECLLIQLKQRGMLNTTEYQVIDKSLDLLGRKKYQEISRKYKMTQERTQEVLGNIKLLQPKPGLAYSESQPHNIVQAEAAIIKNDDGEWEILLNSDPVPKLRISNTYKDLLSESYRDANLKNYLKEQIRSGKFLIKCMHQRQHTLELILKEVVKTQYEFLEKGPRYLKPLTMNRIAQTVGVHETTVSRASANKYVETPWGVLPIKYFFTSGYRTDDGSRMSNTSVKDAINELVSKEDKAKPLSDSDIVSTLKKDGIKLARRTVAKYRSELNILPSNLRK
ncbi:MAG: RNA polymerase factor sigma-54, partial [Verrucomicrobiota bacterium]